MWVYKYYVLQEAVKSWCHTRRASTFNRKEIVRIIVKKLETALMSMGDHTFFCRNIISIKNWLYTSCPFLEMTILIQPSITLLEGKKQYSSYILPLQSCPMNS